MILRNTKNWLFGALLILILIMAACGGQQPSTAETIQPTAVTESGTAETIQPTAVVEQNAADTTQAQTVSNSKLNLNAAGGDEYMAAIPDFSSRMVREFQEYKPYISISQFRKEIGKYVDDAQVAFYEEYVYVPVDANNSDAETIMQIPGVDAAAAEALMAARPFSSNEAFLAKLSELAPGVDTAVAQTYLVQ